MFGGTAVCAGMKVLKWALAGAAVLLLVCQVAISQLCKSNTVLMDGFHTLFLLISIALTADARTTTPPDSSLEFFASPIHTSNLSPESRLGTGPFPPGKNLRQISPPALGCGLNYKQCRIPIVRSFISALVLASLSLSSTIDIIGLFLEPKLVWLPLLLVIISSCSVLLKLLFLWLYWDRFSDASLHLSRGGTVPEWTTPSYINPYVLLHPFVIRAYGRHVLDALNKFASV